MKRENRHDLRVQPTYGSSLYVDRISVETT
jgi:hypothetical protein